ncbi:MAG: uracil-DNA glycosylase family protein [Deltaproteobacteria bacterium]|nr:uracil-DNA glycosylase family protein [Deltaproteobacteria bacterium]
MRSQCSSEGRSLNVLKREILRCKLCAAHLPLGPQPLLRISNEVRILIIGQAPGRVAHESRVPWNDKSGDRLQAWLGTTRETFYGAPEIGLMPMGFCYPGTGKGGDLPPRVECAEAWHEEILARLPQLALTVLIGKYALERYLPGGKGLSVTEAVRGWQTNFPRLLPLPHPSPRNNRWLKSNPWFEEKVLPVLRGEVATLLESQG